MLLKCPAFLRARHGSGKSATARTVSEKSDILKRAGMILQVVACHHEYKLINSVTGSYPVGSYCTGLSKRNCAKFRELSLIFPKLADWLCMGWPTCLAALGREFSNRRTFLLNDPVQGLLLRPHSVQASVRRPFFQTPKKGGSRYEFLRKVAFPFQSIEGKMEVSRRKKGRSGGKTIDVMSKENDFFSSK